jgi:hypothetical protein
MACLFVVKAQEAWQRNQCYTRLIRLQLCDALPTTLSSLSEPLTFGKPFSVSLLLRPYISLQSVLDGTMHYRLLHIRGLTQRTENQAVQLVAHRPVAVKSLSGNMARALLYTKRKGENYCH